jgi:hypothetical protein
MVKIFLERGDTSRVNSNYGFMGGGIQFDLKGQYIGEFKEIGKLQDWSLEK